MNTETLAAAEVRLYGREVASGIATQFARVIELQERIVEEWKP